MATEYRVRWRRLGRNPVFRIYQHGDSACRKIAGLLAFEAIKRDTERYADMPDLATVPELQIRDVGEWRPSEYQPTASEWDHKRVADWASWTGAYVKPGAKPIESDLF